MFTFLSNVHNILNTAIQQFKYQPGWCLLSNWWNTTVISTKQKNKELGCCQCILTAPVGVSRDLNNQRSYAAAPCAQMRTATTRRVSNIQYSPTFLLCFGLHQLHLSNHVDFLSFETAFWVIVSGLLSLLAPPFIFEKSCESLSIYKYWL